MERTAIDYGIHLGTRYSQIAVCRGTKIEVFKNNEGQEHTSSAVWMDKKNRLWVGCRAEERLESDPDNAFSEFKLQMGTTDEKVFVRSGKHMKPEELSAEVLKALRATVKQRTGEDLEAAVITVPAAFESSQREATIRAAKLAGLRQSPLITEPVAAALAYGFQSVSDKVFWLVYDFGGGTFDATIIQVRDGVIQVVNHSGDNYLGGKLIDWAIVDELLIPAVTRAHHLADFRRGNPTWRSAIAKLKMKAEEAKFHLLGHDLGKMLIDLDCVDDTGRPIRGEYHIRLTDSDRLGAAVAIVDKLLIPSINRDFQVLDFERGNPRWKKSIEGLTVIAEEARRELYGRDSAEIIIDFLCLDDGGRPVRFEYEIKKSAVEMLAEPFALRSINICKKVLTDKRPEASSVEKIIIVGDARLTHYLRQRLADPDSGIGIPLDSSVDSLTAIVRGAAVFAGTQRLKVGAGQPVPEGQFAVELNYKPMGPDTEPPVGGRVVATHSKDFSGFTIEFINGGARPPWRSGKLGLGPDGTFVTNVWAEKGHANTFEIELCDATGRPVDTVPARFSYTVGMVITDQPLIHSIGVATVGNEMRWFFEKGTPLPACRRCIVKTERDAEPGEGLALIRLLVMEGESSRVNRNHCIGVLEVSGCDLRRPVPAGTDVEVTLDINELRLITVKAYIPVLDEEYENVVKIGYERVDPAIVRKDFDCEKARLDQVRKKVETTRAPEAEEILERIDGERMVHEVEGSLDAARADPDAAQKAENRLGDLKIALDQAEGALDAASALEALRKGVKALYGKGRGAEPETPAKM